MNEISWFLDIPWVTKILIVTPILLALLNKIVRDYIELRSVRKRLFEAEKEAFKDAPKAIVTAANLRVADPNVKARDVKSSQKVIQVGILFDLYNKQIDRYQTETLARAEWSFLFAIVAMLAGLGFVVWGGAHLITSPGWENLAAGTMLSTIGGVTGAFIAKTFLDVHRLSLGQLNHYFRQPVLNAHVLTAQRLADQLEDPIARQCAYEKIINNVANLICEDNHPTDVGNKS